MCHLILGLPIIALPLLWLLPLTVAFPLYVLILALTVAAYLLTFKAMRRPVTAGAEALMKAVGTVRAVERHVAYVWVASESWAATCADGPLAIGDAVEVTGRDGLTLQVRRLASSPASDQLNNRLVTMNPGRNPRGLN